MAFLKTALVTAMTIKVQMKWKKYFKKLIQNKRMKTQNQDIKSILFVKTKYKKQDFRIQSPKLVYNQ